MVAVRLAPARILVAGSVVAVAGLPPGRLVRMVDAMARPEVCAAPATGEGVVVAVFDPGPAYRRTLRPGDVITAIEARDGTLLPLSAVTITCDTSLAAHLRCLQPCRGPPRVMGAVGQDEVTLVRADSTRCCTPTHRAVRVCHSTSGPWTCWRPSPC
jgi:hypothetical protein